MGGAGETKALYLLREYGFYCIHATRLANGTRSEALTSYIFLTG